MRAIHIAKPGGPEVLELRDTPAPEPGRGEIRVRVRATAVNRADILQRMGMYPAPADAPQDIPGLEYAGEVDAVGAGVRLWKPGDRVFGLVGGGSYAEQLVTHEREAARIPDGLGFRDAAAMPEAFVTAYDAMVEQAGLRAGETVLINAVASGVGTAAVQIARAIGARSIGTTRTAAKLERVMALGLDEGVVAEDGAFAGKLGRKVDVVLELVGGRYLDEDLGCIAPTGRIVLVGLMAGARCELNLGALLTKRVTVRGTVLRSRPLEEKIAAGQLLARQLVPLIERGALRPVVDRTFPLERMADAHAYVQGNESVGKIVIEL